MSVLERDEYREEAKARAWWDAMPTWMKFAIVFGLGGAGSFGGMQFFTGKAQAAPTTPPEVLERITKLEAAREVYEEKFRGVERRLDNIESLQMEILREVRRGRLLSRNNHAEPDVNP